MKLCTEWVFLVKTTTTIKMKIALPGSQAVKLMSQGQIAAIEEDMQYFSFLVDFDFMTRWTKIKICPTWGPVSHTLALPLQTLMGSIHNVIRSWTVFRKALVYVMYF